MFGSTLVLVALVIFWYMLALFLTALTRRNNSIIDIAWGPGFLLAALVTLWWNKPEGYLPLLSTVLVAVWAMRLGVHILMRNWGMGEDARYVVLRNAWRAWFVPRTFAQIFMVQGAVLIVVSLPVLWMNTYGGPLNWLVLVGAIVWLKGFLWEAISDAQLQRFLKHPTNHGKILKTGLWKFSRHPNYFGEMAQWWGLWLMALTIPGGWVTIVGPLTITYMLTRVSGVPKLEAHQMKNPSYRGYARHTPSLIPKLWK